MITVYIYALFSVILVSLVSFVGLLTLSIKADVLKRYVFVLISLAVGTLLGDVFIHLIPEAFQELENTNNVSVAIIAGILIFFILEKFLHWHHHAIDEEREGHEETIHNSGKMILFSDGLHNFIDGLIIGSSYLINIEVGIATTIAVILHEIPQEIGDFSILLHAGYKKSRALFLNFLSASVSILGAIFSFVLGSMSDFFIIWLLPLAAGGFIYVAMSDLIPELHKKNTASQSLLQLGAIFMGVLLMFLLLFL
jgi:zinc and cadmium transporter